MSAASRPVLPLLVAGVMTGLLSACAPSDGGTAAPPGASTGPQKSPSSGQGQRCRYDPSGDPAKPVDPPAAGDVRTSGETARELQTNQGPVTITMDRSRTPCTVHAFTALAQQQFFDGTQCHRLVDSGIFVLQCGDPTGTGRGGPGFRFSDEISGGEKYPAGTVAMANSGPNTNGSQFFLVYADSELSPNYTVFGQLDKASLDVVARIAAEGQDGSNPDGSGRPNNEARIIKVTQKS